MHIPVCNCVVRLCTFSVCGLYTVSAQIVEDNAIVLTIPLNVSHFKALNTLEVSMVLHTINVRTCVRMYVLYVCTYVRTVRMYMLPYSYIDSLDASAHLALTH